MTKPIELPAPDVECGNYAGPIGEGASEDLWNADSMRACAEAAVAAQAAELEALRAAFLRCIGECMTERAWREMRSDPKHFINVAFGGYPFDAARAALKEQTPNVGGNRLAPTQEQR